MLKALRITGLFLLFISLAALLLISLKADATSQPVRLLHCRQGETYAHGGCTSAFTKGLTP